MSEYLTAAQAAEIKSVAKVTIYDWAKRKKIDTACIAGHNFIVNNEKFANIEKKFYNVRWIVELEKKIGDLGDRVAKLESKESGK